MQEICSKNSCTGCYACYNVCPKGAIEMEENCFGEIYPKINEEKCINCGLCKKVCPEINNVKLNEPINAYALYSKDVNTRKKSTSGGAATMFCEYILDNNGVVYGTDNLNNGQINFIRIVDKNQLYRIKGSKYVHAYVGDMYKRAKEDLENNLMVLFVGTPCQVAGFKNFLGKEYINLFLVDIVCHGVPSQKLLKDEFVLNGLNIENIKRITFRDMNGYYLKCFDYDEKQILSKSENQIYYYHNFLKANIFRENCYSCRYATASRVSDITIGDFWGLDKNSDIYDDEKNGISLALPITEKGVFLLEQIKEKSIFEERSIEEAVNGNTQLRKPVEKSKKYITYRKNYVKYGYDKTMKKMRTVKEIIKDNKIIYGLYKKLKEKN